MNHCRKPPNAISIQAVMKSDGEWTDTELIITCEATMKSTLVGNPRQSIRKSMISPASKQVASVETHIPVPIKKTVVAPASHAVFKQIVICLLILRFVRFQVIG